MDKTFLEKESSAGGSLDRDSSAQPSEGLLSDAAVCALFVVWTAVWLVAHFVVWPLWNYLICRGGAASSSSVNAYRRRLCRSQAYCLICVAAAALLFSRCSRLPHDLLYDFTIYHQVFFTMATGHWLVSIWEDSKSWTYLAAGLTEKDLRVNTGGKSDVSLFLLGAYVAHHLVAACGFAAVVLTKACTAIGSFGLLFELPVLFLNNREFLVLADNIPDWWTQEMSVKRYWSVITATFVIGRFVPAAVYIYSLYAWRDDLSNLSYLQTALYHGMALFFTMLNYQYFSIFIQAWYRHDLRRLGAPEAATWEANERDRAAIDESVKPLMRVAPNMLEGKNGRGEDGELWLEVDGIAYDLTHFLEKHPGGPAVLRHWAGKDASYAFHKIGHSQRAQIQMQGMSVGPVVRPVDHYRIFEHPEELLHAAWEGLSCAFSYAVLLNLLGSSLLPSLMPDIRQGDTAELTWACLTPGFVVALVGAGGTATLLTMSLQWGTLSISGSLIGWALAANLHFAGLSLLRRPLPAELQEQGCPTGLELSAAAVWLVEELLEASGFELHSLIGLAVLIASWHLRGAKALLTVAPEHLLAALVVSCSTAWMVRRVSAVTGTRSRREVVSEFFGGILAAGVVGAGGLLWVTPPNISKVEVMDFIWSQSLWDLGMTGGSCQFAIIATGTLLNTAYLTSAPWAGRCLAFFMALGAWLAGGFSSWRWLMFMGIIFHLTALAARNRAYLAAAATNGSFGKVSMHALGTQSLWDHSRAFALTVFWRTLVGGIRRVVHYMLPQELTVYAVEIPIFDLGPDVDLGVAAHFQPAVVKNQTLEAKEANRDKPGYFVCNVGHIDNTHHSGLGDMQRTMNALRDVWHEFQKPDVKGLISNIVCVFPKVGSNLTKEINLSTWTSSKEVHEWYVKSAGHRNIMTQNNSGYLRTFGSLLASMAPVREVRHQDRCTRCARVVESENIGSRAPARCPHCGAKTFGYPFV